MQSYEFGRPAFARLAASTPPATVEALATLTQAELDRLAQLTDDLGDPARTGHQLAALKTKLQGQIAQLDRLFVAISNDSAAELRRLALESEGARQAAGAASGALFGDEQLQHIGSEVWQSLWESARAYSVSEAYPDREFPVTEPGSVCILCQQDLSPQAADRLNRFEAFVRDDSQQRADNARAAYDSALVAFRQNDLTLGELGGIVRTIRDDLLQDALASDVRRAALTAMWRHRQIIRRHTDATAVIDIAVVALPIQALADQVADVTERACGRGRFSGTHGIDCRARRTGRPPMA